MGSRWLQSGLRFFAVLIVLGLVSAACGDDDTGDTDSTEDTAQAGAEQADATDAAEATEQAAPEQTTTEQAATEQTDASGLSGKLMWWTNWSTQQTEAFIAAFNEVHPDIEVEYLRSDDAETTERFRTQTEAGVIDADIVIVGWDGFSRLWEQQGQLHAFDSPEKNNIPEELRDPSGAWYTYGNMLKGICYNSERIEELGLDPLQNWEDLADPQYRGEIVMQDILKVGSGAHAMMIETRAKWEDDARWEAFWEGYSANDVVFQADYPQAQQQMAQGNFAVLGLCYLDPVQVAINQGAPVVWVAPEYVMTVGFTVNIPANAPNIKNAEAFVNYLISRQGQAAVANIVGQVPASPDAPYPPAAQAATDTQKVRTLVSEWGDAEWANNAQWYVERAKEWFDLS